jgi:hypothetical protein
MSRGATVAWIVVAWAALAPGGCRRAPELTAPPATARWVTTPAQLLWGPATAGVMGDVRLDNGRITVVVGAVDHAVGFAATGGNIVDATWLPDGEDQINQVCLYLNDEFPRQARYTSLEIVAPGGGTKAAVVRARGTDTADGRIAIETDYTLSPGEDALAITSRFVSTATYTITRYELGDAIQWGRAEHFAPGIGFDLRGKRPRLPWVAGIGQGTSYALVPTGSVAFGGPHGSMWSDPIGQTVDLEPGKAAVYTRHLAVGRGDTASLATTIARLRGDVLGRVRGRARTSGGAALSAGLVRALDAQGRPVGLATVSSSGTYDLGLVAGRYRLELAAPGRAVVAPSGTAGGEVDIEPAGVVERDFDIGPPAVIAWRVDGEDGLAPPVKVTFVGLGGTPTPSFGPSYLASGSANVVLSARGIGEAAVGAGRYRVIVSRGPEFELIEQEVVVAEGQRPVVAGTLVRSVDTRGLVSADMHQHSVPSFDSGVSLLDRVVSNAAEGVDVVVSTDHNVITDFRPVVASSGLGRTLASMIGTEATTHSVGHFNVFPLHIVRDHPRGGMVDVEGMSPRQIFDFTRGLGDVALPPFVQVNHPRAGYIGYFDLMKLSARTGTTADRRFAPDFDGSEVVSFGWKRETEAVLEDWFGMLRRGRHVTATGNSDSHTIFVREVGWPRTYACVDDDHPTRFDERAFTRALRAGCATISAGPLVTIRSGATRMGGLAPARWGRFELDVDVQAPRWIATDRLTIYVDGQPAIVLPIRGREPRRYTRHFVLRCEADCFVVARVDGDTPLTPVLAAVDGRTPLPIGLTNPIYVDVDGDGLFHGVTR